MQSNYSISFFLILATLTLVLAPNLAARQDWASLKSLKAVRIVIEDLQPQITTQGLVEDSLRVKIELRLRQAGFTVSGEANEYLYLNVNTLFVEGIKHFVYNTKLDFDQNVRLLRTDGFYPAATTWTRSHIGIAPADSVVEEITSSVLGLIDLFLDDLLAANPKKQ